MYMFAAMVGLGVAASLLVSSPVTAAQGGSPDRDGADTAWRTAAGTPAPAPAELAPTPLVSGITPHRGPAGGGTTVTVVGTGLSGVTQVTFGGTPGTDLIVEPSGISLTVVTPPGDPGSVDVAAETDSGIRTIGDFTYRRSSTLPRIDSVNPGEGTVAGGTTTTVSGDNFIPEQTGVTICDQVVVPGLVTVGGTFNVLTFPTPACAAGTTTLSVTTPAGNSNEVTFRYVGDPLPDTESPAAHAPVNGAPPTGLPVTGPALGPVATSGVLAILLGAALRLATGQWTRAGRRRRVQR